MKWTSKSQTFIATKRITFGYQVQNIHGRKGHEWKKDPGEKIHYVVKTVH